MQVQVTSKTASGELGHIRHMSWVVEGNNRRGLGSVGTGRSLNGPGTNAKFGDFVFFDMLGWQTEYGLDCVYRAYFRQLVDKVNYTCMVWDIHFGKIEDRILPNQGARVQLRIDLQCLHPGHGQHVLFEPVIRKNEHGAGNSVGDVHNQGAQKQYALRSSIPSSTQ